VSSAQDDREGVASSHSSAGLELARSGHLAEAERELQQAVSLRPENPLFEAQLGSVLGLEGKLGPAAICLSKAVALEPRNASYRRELAAVQWQLGQLKEAEADLQILLHDNPGDHSAILLLGMVREGQGKFQEAARLLSSEMDLVSSRPERVLALIHSYYASGQAEKARDAASILVRNAATSGWEDSLYAGVHLAIQVHDWEEAGRLLQPLSAANSEATRFQLELANLEYHRGDLEGCEQRLTQLEKTSSGNKWIDGLLGKCYAEQQKYDPAIDYLKRAVDSDPGDLTNYESLLIAYENTNNLGSAMTLASRAVALYATKADAWTLMGSVQIASGHFLEAIESYKRALTLDPANADATIGLGNSQLLGGRPSDARATYEKGIEAFPDDPRLYTGFATALTRSSDATQTNLAVQVESLLRKAIALDDSLPAAHYLLGQSLLERGRLQDALAELQIAAKQDPNSGRIHYALQRTYRRLGRVYEATKEFELFQKLKGDNDNDPMSNRPDPASE